MRVTALGKKLSNTVNECPYILILEYRIISRENSYRRFSLKIESKEKT